MTTTQRHEVKDNLAAADEDDFRIVEAYGDRKYPKLVEQVASDVLQIRINALTVLCDEFNTPQGVFGCCAVGVVQVIASMCTDSNANTRLLAARACALVARDSYGSSTVLEEGVVSSILEAAADASQGVRAHVYECMLQLSRTSAGALACAKAGVSRAMAKCLASEVEALQPLLLRCLHNMSAVEEGLEDALDAHVVKRCILLLACDNAVLRAEAARTLGFLCFSERGKNQLLTHMQAVEGGAVVELINVLGSSTGDNEMLSAGSLALMAVTSTDEGKRQLGEFASTVELLVDLLHCNEKVVMLNALKVIANAAVLPSLRNQLKRSEACLSTLERLVGGSDDFVKRHARTTLDAVMWKP